MSATPAEILAMIEDGGKAQAIADVTGLPRGYILQVARENGYGVNAANDRFQKAAQAKPKPQGIELVDEPEPVPDDGCAVCEDIEHLAAAGEVAEIIAQRLGLTAAAIAKHVQRHDHPRKRMFFVLQAREINEKKAAPRPAVRDVLEVAKGLGGRTKQTAERIERDLAKLTDAVKEAAIRAEEKARAAAEREKQQAEVRALEERLRAAKAALRSVNVAGRPAVQPKQIRAWASDNGIVCPATGPVPRAVVDAYLQAVAA